MSVAEDKYSEDAQHNEGQVELAQLLGHKDCVIGIIVPKRDPQEHSQESQVHLVVLGRTSVVQEQELSLAVKLQITENALRVFLGGRYF